MYRRVLRRHALRFGAAALRHAFSVRMIRRVLNTLRYPAKVEDQYPSAELLSIVVAPEARGSGAATALLEALLAEFRARNVAAIKVMVRADFERANAYYRKHGFRLAGQITTHGHPANVYTLETKPA
jgi:ribosomal protein S18 acetylase RimI-like enzyme